MQKLSAIHTFLLSLNLFAAEDIDSWAEHVRYIAVVKHEGQGITLMRVDYDAVIAIERFNPERIQPELLFAQVMAWLLNNDADREDYGQETMSLDTDVDILDDDTADVQITVPFVEFVQVVPDPAGSIVIGGVNYKLADVPINYAEEGEVQEQ